VETGVYIIPIRLKERIYDARQCSYRTGPESIQIATPYLDEVNQREVDYLEQAGFEVISICGLNLEKDSDMVRVAPDYIAEFALAQDHVCRSFKHAFYSSANLDYATDAWAFDFAKGVAVINARNSKLQVLMVASPK